MHSSYSSGLTPLFTNRLVHRVGNGAIHRSGILDVVAGLCGILGPWIFVVAIVGLVLNVFWAGWLAMVLKKG
ncbi:MAG: hypothetical protein ABI780_10525 [Ardenticatenales bacterium]